MPKLPIARIRAWLAGVPGDTVAIGRADLEQLLAAAEVGGGHSSSAIAA